MSRIDDYEHKPSGMSEYLSTYGWHFSKRMAEFAAGKLFGSKILDLDTFASVAANTDISIKNKGYDGQYLFCRIRNLHPYLSEQQAIRQTSDILSNYYDTSVFTEFYADCLANDIPIIWEDML